LTGEIIEDLKEVMSDFKDTWSEKSATALSEGAAQPATAGALPS